MRKPISLSAGLHTSSTYSQVGTLYGKPGEKSGKVGPRGTLSRPLFVADVGLSLKYEVGPLPESLAAAPLLPLTLEPPPPARSGPTRARAVHVSRRPSDTVALPTVRPARHPRRGVRATPARASRR